jgi:hypothetical protein
MSVARGIFFSPHHPRRGSSEFSRRFFLITFSFHAHIIETPNSKQIGSIAPKKEDNKKKNEQFPYLFFSKKKERGFDFYLFKR